MKNYIKLFLLIFTSLSFSKQSFSQGITLAKDAKLSLKGEDVIFSSPSVRVLGKSQIIQAEAIKLKQSDFIQILSSDAVLKTRILGAGENAFLPVGIDSRADIVIVNQSASSAFSIGMNELADPDALPFSWKIGALNSSSDEVKAAIDFSWDKSAEPNNFDLRALLIKKNGEWDLPLNQEVNDVMVKLYEFSDFESEGSVFTVKNFERDLDEDEVPDIIEIGQTTEMTDPGNYLDSDGDGVPDYLEKRDGTDPNDPNVYLDAESDGVPDYVGYRSPVGFMDLKNVLITWGLENYKPLFKDSVLTMLGSGRLINLPLDWDYSALNIYKRGNYPVESDLKLPRGVFNAYEMIAKVDGVVLPKPSPLDVDLTNSEFIGDDEIFFIPIGAFIVEDPIDQIHQVELLGSEYDNKYFEIKKNILFWSSAARAEGIMTFKILVRVTDRDGNTLEKIFEINRGRANLDEIQINNTFTPNKNGVNDTWGIPEIRFFRGARVQVFDRNGERVFYTEDPDVRWDGTYKDKDLPVGTYFWVMEIRETGEMRRGILNLIRE